MGIELEHLACLSQFKNNTCIPGTMNTPRSLIFIVRCTTQHNTKLLDELIIFDYLEE